MLLLVFLLLLFQIDCKNVPLFGRRLTLTLPVPGPFLTRIISFFTGKPVPTAYFDVLYLDADLRVHRTGQNATFVQRRPAWSS